MLAMATRYRDRPASVLKLGVCKRETLIRLAGIGELKGIHQLHATIVGTKLRGLGCRGHGFLPLMRLAIAVDLALIAADDVVAAKRDHLLVGVDGFGGVVRLAIDDAKTVEEDSAVRLFPGRRIAADFCVAARTACRTAMASSYWPSES